LAKQDFSPILAAGIHKRTLEQIRTEFVSPFPDDGQRLRLFALLEQWVTKLHGLNVVAILWIDGSFVTIKPSPNDIDCVLWNPSFSGPVSDAQQVEVSRLVDRAVAKAQYGVDLYIELPTAADALHREAYWRGLFGFEHNGKYAKGFVELTV
jgi:hypothetical protein